ncbi:MAG: T9SS type A sorting domain-containing protein, partial [Bacteroidota bacterium]
NMTDHGDIVYTGFIAQEVDQVINEMGTEWSGVKKPANAKDHFGLRYAEFTVPLVKATQEQQQIIEEQQEVIEELESRIERLEQLVLAATNDKSTNTNNEVINIDLNNTPNASRVAQLYQNTPNPFNGVTEIKAYISEEVTTASLVITDLKGQVLVNQVINQRGQVNTRIDATTLSQGNYIYTLVIDGKNLDSKSMVLNNNN